MDSDAAHGRSTEEPGTEDDQVTEAFAEIGDAWGWSARDVVDVIGGGWQPYAVEPAGSEFDLARWYVAGRPVQLMLGLDGDRVVLAVPEGRWSGASTLRYAPAPSHFVVLEARELRDKAPEIVRTLLARRRRSFRWCRYCRRVTAPEELMDADQCMRCASAWDGVVY